MIGGKVMSGSVTWMGSVTGSSVAATSVTWPTRSVTALATGPTIGAVGLVVGGTVVAGVDGAVEAVVAEEVLDASVIGGVLAIVGAGATRCLSSWLTTAPG